MAPDQEQTREFARMYGQVVARSWADEEFKARLLADPAAVLREEGFPVPTGIEVRAVESTDSVLYLNLPPRPSDELSDEQLDQVAGGSTLSTASSLFSCLLTLSSLE